MTEPNHTPGHDTTPAPKRLMRRYTEEDVQRGLTELALCNGNYRYAEARLSERGHDIPGETIRKWAQNQHADRYEHIRTELVPRIHEKLASEAEDGAALALAVHREATELAREHLAAGKIKDTPRAAKDLAMAAGILIDKANVERGRPTNITEHRDIAGILRSLEANIPGVQPAIDTTATEITSRTQGTSNRESEARRSVPGAD